VLIALNLVERIAVLAHFQHRDKPIAHRGILQCCSSAIAGVLAMLVKVINQHNVAGYRAIL
jgi:hypothetical protein